MKFAIYCHTNTNNGKRYIGWTKLHHNKSPERGMMRRWKQHCLSANKIKCKWLFQKAIRKWGQSCWLHELLDVVTTITNAKHAEVLWIAQRNSFAFDGHGYNMTRGGNGTVGHQKSEFTRKKIGDANRGKRRSIDQRIMMGNARKGISPYNKGTKMTREQRLFLSKNHHGKKCVRQLTIDGMIIAIHNSIIEAARSIGQTNSSAISGCCHKRKGRKTAYGFMWKFE